MLGKSKDGNYVADLETNQFNQRISRRKSPPEVLPDSAILTSYESVSLWLEQDILFPSLNFI